MSTHVKTMFVAQRNNVQHVFGDRDVFLKSMALTFPGATIHMSDCFGGEYAHANGAWVGTVFHLPYEKGMVVIEEPVILKDWQAN